MALPIRRDTSQASLMELFERLTNDMVQLVGDKFTLASLEFREDLTRMAREAGIIAASLVTLVYTGFILFSVGLGFLVGTALGFWAGFMVVGVLYLVVGGGVAWFLMNKLKHERLELETSKEELRKDRRWLKNKIMQ